MICKSFNIYFKEVSPLFFRLLSLSSASAKTYFHLFSRLHSLMSTYFKYLLFSCLPSLASANFKDLFPLSCSTFFFVVCQRQRPLSSFSLDFLLCRLPDSKMSFLLVVRLSSLSSASVSPLSFCSLDFLLCRLTGSNLMNRKLAVDIFTSYCFNSLIQFLF